MSDLLRIQADLVKLPSLGAAYDLDKIPLINGDSVRVRKFVNGDRREMLAAIGSKDVYAVYTKILERLLIDPRVVNYDDFLITDIMTIFYLIKIHSFGPMAQYEYVCRCGKYNEYVHDLTTLMVTYSNEIENYAAQNLVIDLPDSGQKVSYHLARLGDELKVDQFLQDLKKGERATIDDVDEDYVRTAIQIDAINGERLPTNAKFEKVLEWTLEDQELFSEATSHADTGILLNQVESKCRGCGRNSIINLGVTPDFFRPGVRRSKPAGDAHPSDDVQELQLDGHGVHDPFGIERSVPNGS